MENKKSVVIMARVSSDEQAKGYSLDVQKEALEKYCEKHNLTVGHIIKEDHSAKTFNRPAFKEFLDVVKNNKGKFSQLLFASWDRFSRNTSHAFAMIDRLREMGIECNAIEQPLDMRVPENKLILSVYLTIPEIDNDRRSIKIRGGIRGALKSGRWSRAAPIGFKNERDHNNKPLIVPSDTARYIVKAFKMISNGYAQSEVLRELKNKPINITKSNLSRILRSPVYMGKIVVPKLDNEPEVIIEGVHQGIVSESLFNKVQLILSGSRQQKNKNIEHDELPLRGFITCSVCGKVMTGSRSRGHNGNRYFYYHCVTPCKSRYPSGNLNKKIEALIAKVNFPEEQIELFEKIITDKIENGNNQARLDSKTLKIKLAQLRDQEEHLDDSFISNVINGEKYNKLSDKIKLQIIKVKSDLASVKNTHGSLKSQIKEKVKELQDFSGTYNKSDIYNKRLMISSMFPEKIEIFEGQCRTKRLNSAVVSILLEISEIKDKKNAQNRKKSSLSRLVESAGIEPASKKGIKMLSTCLVYD